MDSVRRICTHEQRCGVLLVEDDPRVVDLFKEIFKDPRLGVVLRLAGSLSGSRKRLHDPDLELVLLDVGLPDSDGADTVRVVIEETGGRVPVIVVTGSFEYEDACWKAGAADFLTKPLRNLDIIGRVKWAILNQREKNRMRDYCEKLEKEVSRIKEIEKSGSVNGLTEVMRELAEMARSASP